MSMEPDFLTLTIGKQKNIALIAIVIARLNNVEYTIVSLKFSQLRAP